MNKQERIDEMLQLLKEAETSFFSECKRIGNQLAMPCELAFIQLPKLIEAHDELNAMRKICKYNRRESALVVRNNWSSAILLDKSIRDLLKSTHEYRTWINEPKQEN